MHTVNCVYLPYFFFLIGLTIRPSRRCYSLIALVNKGRRVNGKPLHFVQSIVFVHVIISRVWGNISITRWFFLKEEYKQEKKHGIPCWCTQSYYLFSYTLHRKTRMWQEQEMAACIHCAVSNEPVFLCMHSYIKFKDKIGRFIWKGGNTNVYAMPY